MTASEATEKSMFLGFTLAVLCNEDLPYIDRAAAEKASRGTFLGNAEIDAWTTACSRWPASDLPADFAQIPPSSVPALLLSGEVDPVVPPLWAELALASFRRGRHLIVPATAHNTSHVGCTGRLIESFLTRGAATELDATCLGEVAAPPFITSFAGARP